MTPTPQILARPLPLQSTTSQLYAVLFEALIHLKTGAACAASFVRVVGPILRDAALHAIAVLGQRVAVVHPATDTPRCTPELQRVIPGRIVDRPMPFLATLAVSLPASPIQPYRGHFHRGRKRPYTAREPHHHLRSSSRLAAAAVETVRRRPCMAGSRLHVLTMAAIGANSVPATAAVQARRIPTSSGRKPTLAPCGWDFPL